MARQVLAWLLSAVGPGLPIIRWLLLGALIVAVVVVATTLVVRRIRKPRGRDRGESPSQEEWGVQDHFRRATDLAVLGDFNGAVRELALGVAVQVNGPDRSDLSGSPLTVREIYRASGDYGRLRPLLLAFEQSFYGHHAITEERYHAVLAIANRYRGLVREAA